MSVDRQPLVSIMVVSYNTCEMTLACLNSVFAETRLTDFEVIVLDNASSDGSGDAIAAEFGSRICFIASKENLGFAAGNNLAAKHARGQFLLLLNPDTVVLTGGIDRLLEFAKANPNAGIWGGRTVFADGSLNPGSCWSRQTLWSLVAQVSGLSSIFRKTTVCNPEGIGSWDRTDVRPVDIVSGCFLLTTCRLWNELKGFDPDFFMYGEDADLCLRARTLGTRPLVTGSAVIVHYGGGSERIRSDKIVRLLKAKTLLIDHHFPSTSRPLGLWLLSLWPLSRFWAHSVMSLFNRTPGQKVWREVWCRRAEWIRPSSGA